MSGFPGITGNVVYIDSRFWADLRPLFTEGYVHQGDILLYTRKEEEQIAVTWQALFALGNPGFNDSGLCVRLPGMYCLELWNKFSLRTDRLPNCLYGAPCDADSGNTLTSWKRFSSLQEIPEEILPFVIYLIDGPDGEQGLVTNPFL